MFFRLSFQSLVILDTETAAHFFTVSFLTLGSGVCNPLKRSLHSDSSLRLTEKILKVPVSWGQEISTLEITSLQPVTSHKSDLIPKFGSEIRK